MVKDDLGDRMKDYERVSKMFLMRRNPVIIRLDGKAFHTFTKGLKKPYDKIIIETMNEVTQYLCKNIQGCKIGYTQSDEISLLLVDYDKLDSHAWFNGNIQKIVSVSASMATLQFNKVFREKAQKLMLSTELEDFDYRERLESKLDTALFDSRVFSLPKSEVVNYFIYRQLDAIRNSKQALGQSVYSHKELHNKSCIEIVEDLKSDKGIDWDSLDNGLKWGRSIIKEDYNLGEAKRTRWITDIDTPEFKEYREYIEKYI